MLALLSRQSLQIRSMSALVQPEEKDALFQGRVHNSFSVHSAIVYILA